MQAVIRGVRVVIRGCATITGLNILAIFQKRINSVLEEHLDEFIIAYLDNIIIYSNSKEKYF